LFNSFRPRERTLQGLNLLPFAQLFEEYEELSRVKHYSLFATT